MGHGTHEKFVEIAQKLSERYGVTATPLAPGRQFHCSHGP